MKKNQIRLVPLLACLCITSAVSQNTDNQINSNFLLKNNLLVKYPTIKNTKLNIYIHLPELITDGVAKLKTIKGTSETKRIISTKEKNKFLIEKQSLEIRVPSEDDSSIYTDDIQTNILSFWSIGKIYDSNVQFKKKKEISKMTLDSSYYIQGFKYKTNKFNNAANNHLYNQELHPVLHYYDQILFEIYGNENHKNNLEPQLTGNPNLLYEPENEIPVAISSHFFAVPSVSNSSFSNGENYSRIFFKRIMTSHKKIKTGSYINTTYRIEGVNSKSNNNNEVVIRYLQFESETLIPIELIPYGKKKDALRFYNSKKEQINEFLVGKENIQFLIEPEDPGCIKVGWLIYNTLDNFVSEINENGICKTYKSSILNMAMAEDDHVKEIYHMKFLLEKP
ncbi:hypothetical protein EHR01_12400 [Leptospira mtsangambouensis]|uniref:DUF4139 domain-containing protein n=1 Tax=Leptospira mtsangambouensis TaxID=2484912 RepID=A0ABY2NYS5_9LEPT|nr:hypothetical protein [Leptospira mtsangambouensis]TGM74296.1 hypothetical protein EHR01_12400 [Leptospira mtsangambouensis]